MTAHDPPDAPLGRFLSGGRLVSLVTQRGTGHLSHGGVAITRSPMDAGSGAAAGAWYVRDRDSGASFVIGSGPMSPPEAAPAPAAEPGTWSLACAREGLVARMTCWADEDSELREIEIANTGDQPRSVDLTCCAEVVLQPAAADLAHPVFSKLFVQTEWRPDHHALLARRRPRGADERHPWLLAALDGPGAPEHETDRARFLGRGRTWADPRALDRGAALGGTTGNVLDPVVALRRATVLAPGARARWIAIHAVGDGPDALMARLAALRAPEGVASSRAAAAAAEQRRRREAGIDDAAADRAQDLLVALAHRDPSLRAAKRAATLVAPAPDTFAVAGVDGDRWLAVVEADAPGGAETARALLAIAPYARALGLPFELLLLARDGSAWPREPGAGIAVRDPAALGAERLAHLAAVARAWIAGPLPRPVERREDGPVPGPGGDAAAPAARPPGEPLEHFNGFGGFSADGREYVIRIERDAHGRPALPPLPWTNVIANPVFGTLVSETGAGFTWSGNSREHRLTPWSNDPLLDAHGEALYVRDEASGAVWSPQPGPAPGPGAFEVRHRAGSTTWTVEAHGLVHRTTVGVAADAPVRVARVEIANPGPAPRRLRLVSCVRFVLGGNAGEPGPRTACDAEAHAVTATNPFATDWPGAVAWSAAAAPDGARIRVGDDRAAFLGGGDAAHPRALSAGDSPVVAADGGADPAAIVEVTFEVPAGATRTCSFLLGEEPGRAAVARRLAALRAPGAVDALLAAATGAWDELQSGLRIRTPEPAIDRMVNGWLTYQNLSCRIWGRSAFYQSGGAFGFRDQLQDACALVWQRPDLTRAQILLHAAHQFVEGDVLHWWHPPRSRGIRTRFADDLLWLPYLAAFYVGVTGDAGVLDEVVPFLRARPLEPHEHEVFLEPEDSGERGTVYEHAARAIDRSMAVGAHGMPLFGCGDWNDGMNRVGHDGRGESVWMAFFLHATIAAFAPFAEAHADRARAARWRAHQRALEDALDRHGWDGAWWRRGFYGDGTPLGSATSDECRIDALAQAWSVLSGAVPRERAEAAMRAMETHLLSREDRLVRLLAPPFEHTPHDPGYIKGYVPGVRENGGQYTHAALWVVRAMAELGWRDRAARTLAMLSPLSHASTPADVARYQVEPYVVAADVYGAPPHVGRGGWTWYTGSAGWMQRVAIESVLGLRVEDGRRLRLAPCLPDDWPEARVEWRVPGSGTLLRIRYANGLGRAAAVVRATLDGHPVAIEAGAAVMDLPHDGATHEIVAELG